MTKVTDRQLKARTILMGMGYPVSGAAALLGNFCVESGADLPAAFRNPKSLDHGSQGLPQWRLDRLTNYQNYVKTLHPELTKDADLWPFYGRTDNQLAFVDKELKTDYPLLRAKLMKGGDVAALTTDVCWQYERPNKALAHLADRIAYAQGIATAPLEPKASTPTVLVPLPTVHDELNKTVATHTSEAQGGFFAAAIAAIAAFGLALSNFVERIPMWEWVAFGILAIIILGAISAGLTASAKATTVAKASAGVSNVPVPTEAPTPVAPPPPPVAQSSSAAGVAQTTSIAGISQEDLVAALQIVQAQKASAAAAKANPLAAAEPVPGSPVAPIVKAEPSTGGAALTVGMQGGDADLKVVKTEEPRVHTGGATMGIGKPAEGH